MGNAAAPQGRRASSLPVQPTTARVGKARSRCNWAGNHKMAERNEREKWRREIAQFMPERAASESVAPMKSWNLLSKGQRKRHRRRIKQRLQQWSAEQDSGGAASSSVAPERNATIKRESEDDDGPFDWKKLPAIAEEAHASPVARATGSQARDPRSNVIRLSGSESTPPSSPKSLHGEVSWRELMDKDLLEYALEKSKNSAPAPDGLGIDMPGASKDPSQLPIGDIAPSENVDDGILKQRPSGACNDLIRPALSDITPAKNAVNSLPKQHSTASVLPKNITSFGQPATPVSRLGADTTNACNDLSRRPPLSDTTLAKTVINRVLKLHSTSVAAPNSLPVFGQPASPASSFGRPLWVRKDPVAIFGSQSTSFPKSNDANLAFGSPSGLGCRNSFTAFGLPEQPATGFTQPLWVRQNVESLVNARLRSERCLEDLYNENPAKRLRGIEPDTLELMATTVEQVTKEAADRWLKSSCPGTKWQDEIVSVNGLYDFSKSEVDYSVLNKALKLQDVKSDLGKLLPELRNIRVTLNGPMTILALVRIVTFAVTICHKSGDSKCKALLEKAKEKIEWLPVSLDCKKLEVQKQATKRLDALCAKRRELPGLPIGTIKDEETKILDRALVDFQVHRLEFTLEMMRAVQQLLLGASA